jgi:ankyrin repeat protein
MRLLLRSNTGEFDLTEDFIDNNTIPPYAILSHTWDGEEVTFTDLKDGTAKDKVGYNKIQFCGQQAERDGLRYFWVDTCCINKSSSAELQEAINSMFRWYQNAERCYVYLSDVPDGSPDRDDECLRRWKPAFKKCRWFTRGWTLQELIAPASVEFFSKGGAYLGNRQSLEQTVYEITGIAVEALRGRPLSQFRTDERLLWAAKRQTTREEDNAYCLLGIFNIYMPLIYGEGRENALARLQEQVEKISKDKILSLDNDQRRILLDSLQFDQIDARQMTIKSAHAKTCKWLLKRPQYIDWLDTTKLGEHHGLLWIKGKPGAGKSTLMKFSLANARRSMKDRIVISFFFNARGEDLEKSTIGTYRSLLLQLLKQLPALQWVFDSVGLSSSSIRPDHQWGIELLKSLLEQTIQSLGQSSVVCFIDALDECEEEQVRDMVQFFERVGELSASAGIRFQICFSSRHYPHITIRKGQTLVLEGQEGHSQDITNYLESELKIGKSKIAQQIRSEVQEKASGVFMWVVLVVGILNKEHDRGRIHGLRRRLQDIPGDLHKLFRDILTRDSHNRDELVLCIQWVLFAKQPLSPEQLYFAVLSRVEPVSRWDPDEVDKDAINLFILDSSKGLADITTSKNRTVQFIHESVRDFLLKDDGLGDLWPNLRSDLQGQSHEQLKQCCLAYISMDVFAVLNIPEKLPKASSQETADLRKSANDWFPFLEYAVQNVLYHAELAEGSGIAQRSFILNFPRLSWIKLANFFERHEVRRYTEEMSLMYALGERNMPALIKAHPSAVSCLEVGQERYGPPLFAALATRSEPAIHAFVYALSKDLLPGSCLNEIQAHYCEERQDQYLGRNFQFSNRRTVLSYLAELGRPTIVKLLLSMGNVDVDAKDFNGQTPLWRAVENGHDAVVKLLLDTGNVNVYAKDNNGQTLLLQVVGNRHDAVVKLLLDTGSINVDAKDKSEQTPLLWAVENGHDAVVKLLLDIGSVNVNAKDKSERTLLSRAAGNGHSAVVKLLLDIGKVDVNAEDSNGQTPLLRAAENGHDAVVKLLLSIGNVDVNAKDNNRYTPLSRAAENGHDAVVKLLLDTGKVNVNTEDNNGQIPLWRAVENRHEAVVKLLLSTGNVNVNVKDNSGRTLLLWVAEKGLPKMAKRHRAVVRLLLDTGKVDVNAEDNNGQTPLWRAAENGHDAVVKLLLDIGSVNVNAKDKSERTLLSRVAGNGHSAVVKLLLDTGKVDVNAEDSNGQTPLLRAAENGHDAVVKLLLDTGKVDVNAKDNNGHTPLWRAAENGHDAVVKLLLDIGSVNVNAKDKSERTLLSRVAGNGHSAVVKLLLDTGKVDVNAEDSNGQTPLLRAAENGHDAVVKLLLDTGNVDVDTRYNSGWILLSRAKEEMCLPESQGSRNHALEDYQMQLMLLEEQHKKRLLVARQAQDEAVHEAIVKLLLQIGKVDVNSRDKSGRTPLSWAAEKGDETLVKLLLESGKVDVDSKNNSGQTPLFWAASGMRLLRAAETRHDAVW